MLARSGRFGGVRGVARAHAGAGDGNAGGIAANIKSHAQWWWGEFIRFRARRDVAWAWRFCVWARRAWFVYQVVQWFW